MADKEKKQPRDKSGRYVSPVNGAPLPKGTPFTKGDGRARAAAMKSVEKRKERADLRRLCQAWMEADAGKDTDGRAISGGELLVRVAAKEIKRGNARYWELMRDTAGFKPVDKVMVAEVEPAVIAEVESIVREAEDE